MSKYQVGMSFDPLSTAEGGGYLTNIVEYVKEKSASATVFDDSVVPEQSPRPDEDKIIETTSLADGSTPCCMCGKRYKRLKGNFVVSERSPLWVARGGYTPFCRDCADLLFSNLTVMLGGNEEHALQRLCQIFDWPYHTDYSAASLKAVATAKSKGRAISRVATYETAVSAATGRTARNVDGPYNGGTYLTNIRASALNAAARAVDMRKAVKTPTEDGEEPPDPDDFVVTQDMIRAWGSGMPPEHYEYLENEYADWISKNVCNTKAQEELFRQICLAQLDVRNARKKGTKVAEAQKTLQDLMSSANILPKQGADNLLADTQTFGTLLKKYEETSPLPEPDPRWKDVDGIRRYINTWFKGGLAKALKIKNDFSNAYEEEAKAEFEKYTVHPRSAVEESAKFDTSIFDAPQQAENGGDADGNDDSSKSPGR